MNIAISYGTYYQYLRPRGYNYLKRYNIEAEIEVFKDKEIAVQFPDSIRGKHIFIMGDTVHHANELFLTIDAARRSSASKITVVLPYYGYCRQDKKGTGRASIGASMMANIIQSLGANQMIAIDLHSDQIQMGFQTPFEHLSGRHLFHDTIDQLIADHGKENIIFCSPDAGGTDRVKKFGKMFGIDYVGMAKHREKANVVDSMRFLGEKSDIEGKVVIVIDDMCDTGGTLIKTINTLKSFDTHEVYGLFTHPVFSNGAVDKLADANVKIITSNTRNTVVGLKHENFTIVDCGEILHHAIINIANNQSILTELA